MTTRSAFETYLETMSGVLPTQWENVNYTPVTGQPYQAVYMLKSNPDNPTFGDGFYRENGLLQISLRYPQNTGAGAAEAMADKLLNFFPRGLTLTDGANTIVVSKTAQIQPPMIDGDRFVINVRIPYFVNIFPS